MAPPNQQSAFASLPAAAQVQLLQSQLQPGSAQPAMPEPNSPEFRKMVESGSAAMPSVGTMAYLEFARANPDLIDLANRKNGMGGRGQMPGPATNATSYNPFAILSDLLAQPKK